MFNYPRSYRRKPLAIFEHGTRLYAPSAGEGRYRVVAVDVGGSRLFYKFVGEAEARRKAREVGSYLGNETPLRSTPDPATNRGRPGTRRPPPSLGSLGALRSGRPPSSGTGMPARSAPGSAEDAARPGTVRSHRERNATRR